MPGNVRCRRFAREHCHQCILPSVAHWMVNLRSGPSGISRAIQVSWSVVTSECTKVRINGIWLGSHDVVVHSGSLKSPNSFHAILGGGGPMYLQHNGATAIVKGMVVLFAGGFPPTKVWGPDAKVELLTHRLFYERTLAITSCVLGSDHFRLSPRSGA